MGARLVVIYGVSKPCQNRLRSHGSKRRAAGAKETSEMVNCVCTGSYAT